jgi:hypothetical protein
MHPSMQRIFDDVAKFGWHVVGLLAGKDGAPEFSFSIGLFQTYSHPELVVFGLPMNAAHGIIETCLERVSEGIVLEAGQVRDDILTHHSIAVLPVESSFYPEYLGSAIGFYDSLDFPVLQLVWPDKNNHFPWEPDFDQSYAAMQVILNTTAA